MANSKREEICSAFITRLLSITTANGYETNVGANAFEWRVTDFGDDELPCMNFRDTKCETEQKLSGIHEHLLNIEVVMVDKKPAGGITPQKHLRKMVADFWKAMGVDRQWGGMALDTIPVSDEISIEQQDKTLVGANMKLKIKYRTPSFNPYA